MASIGDLVVNLTADSTKMNAALASAQKQLMTFGAAVAAAAGAAVTRFMQVGSSLDDMSQRTGVSVEALSSLSFAAQMSDTSLESLQGSIIKMTRLIGEAQTGSTAASAALRGIGISVRDLQGLSADEQFKRIADRIAGIEDPALRVKAAMDVFGKSAGEILPLLLQGSSGIEAFQDEARRTGQVLDGETAAAAAKAADAIDLLLRVVDATAVKIGAMFAPALTAIVDGFARFIGHNQQLIKVLASAAVGLAAFAGGMKIVTIATQAYAKAQALAQAFSGPKGWAILAGAAIAAGASIATLNSQFSSLNAEMEQAQKNAGQVADALPNAIPQPQAAPETDFEARAKRLAQFQSDFNKFSTASAQGQAEALRNRIAQLTDDFKTLDKYGETELTADQFEKYKQGVVNSITGVTNKIQDLQDELAILRGETTSQEQEFARLSSMGVGADQIETLRKLNAERQSLLDKQEQEQRLIQEREAADERLRQLAEDRKKAMQDEAAAIVDSLKAPEQILGEQIARIQQLQKAGLLTAEQSAAAIAKAQQESAGGVQKVGARFAGAMQRGSAEAYSAIIQAMGQQANPQVKAIEKMNKDLGGKLAKIAEKPPAEFNVVESIG